MALFYVALGIIIGLVGLVFYWIKGKEKAFLQMYNVNTGALMPGHSFLESLYTAIVVRRSKTVRQILIGDYKKYGDTYRSALISPIVTLCRPELVRDVLKKMDEFPKRNLPLNRFVYARNIFGRKSILLVNNPEWHKGRTVLNQSFTSNKVFFEPMKKKISVLVNLWSEIEIANVVDDLQKMTLDVLATCIFGQDFDTLNGKQSEPLEAYNTLVECVAKAYRVIVPYYDYLPFPSNYELSKKAKVFDSYCWEIINEAKKYVDSKEHDESKESIIALMYRSGMSEIDIRDNVGIFFIAGHETTSSTLSWILNCLAMHPEIQTKARNEVLEKVPFELTYESLKDLTYMDCIIKETMRLHPSVPNIGQREVQKDTVIGEWHIPAKTVLQLDFANMLLDEKIWGDPEVYRPERWLPENLTTEQRKSWMPFSYGPRICIGMNFSLTEQKIFLASILKEFPVIKLVSSPAEGNPAGFLDAPKRNLRIKFINETKM